jgi:hypothetical protein
MGGETHTHTHTHTHTNTYKHVYTHKERPRDTQTHTQREREREREREERDGERESERVRERWMKDIQQHRRSSEIDRFGAAFQHTWRPLKRSRTDVHHAGSINVYPRDVEGKGGASDNDSNIAIAV